MHCRTGFIARVALHAPAISIHRGVRRRFPARLDGLECTPYGSSKGYRVACRTPESGSIIHSPLVMTE